MKTLKKFLIGLSAIALIAVFAFLLAQNPNNAKANPSRFAHNYTAQATSTLVSATSTLTFITDGADRADLLLIYRASSSAASLKWTYEYSNNSIDWFGEDYIAAQNNTNAIHASTTPVHFWTPSDWTAVGTTSSSSIKSILNIPVSNANYMRVKFNPVGANGLIWADAIVKVQESN